jgi:hypothetical protein
MTTQSLTQEQAIEHYTELMRHVSVGAYAELEVTGDYPGYDSTLESINNLEKWASRQALEFVWSHDTNTWSLEPAHMEVTHD